MEEGVREGQSVVVRWSSRSAVDDQILIFAGGGMRSSTTSSEAIGQAARFDGFPDDQSVMSFATMIRPGFHLRDVGADDGRQHKRPQQVSGIILLKRRLAI